MYDGAYKDFNAFLEKVVAFIDLWHSKPRSTCESALAREKIFEAKETFFGVGVYTICELFFDAGMFICCIVSIHPLPTP